MFSVVEFTQHGIYIFVCVVLCCVVLCCVYRHGNICVVFVCQICVMLFTIMFMVFAKKKRPILPSCL